MKKLTVSALILVLVTSLLTGCANMKRSDAGLIAGGVVGGAAGSVLTGGSAIGTVGGAVGGAYVGQQLTK